MKLNSIIISLILILITSCSGKQIVSGNLPDIERLTLLEIGKDNKESVKISSELPHLKEHLEIILIIM